MTSTPSSAPPRILVHFTPRCETVGSILEKGLLLVPSPRGLIREFLGDEPAFASAEPQAFGMVSFTELGVSDLSAHRSVFGAYGIALHLDRAVAKGAQRVIYVPSNGALFQSFRWLFRLGYQELEAVSSQREGMGMAATNKAMAAVSGAQLWANLLTLYEYLQPEEHSGQVEWRIVNQVPFDHGIDPKAEIVRKLLAMPPAWLRGSGSVSLDRSDIAGIVCPNGEEERIRALLPEPFQEVSIIPAELSDKGADLLERMGSVPRDASEPIESEPSLGEFALPEVVRVEGFQLFHNKVVRDSYIDLSYIDADGNRNKMIIPLTEVSRLFCWLRDAARDPRFPPAPND